jgi:hypothetical protein
MEVGLLLRVGSWGHLTVEVGVVEDLLVVGREVVFLFEMVLF